MVFYQDAQAKLDSHHSSIKCWNLATCYFGSAIVVYVGHVGEVGHAGKVGTRG
jgi:hypothetical protein